MDVSEILDGRIRDVRWSHMRYEINLCEIRDLSEIRNGCIQETRRTKRYTRGMYRKYLMVVSEIQNGCIWETWWTFPIFGRNVSEIQYELCEILDGHIQNTRWRIQRFVWNSGWRYPKYGMIVSQIWYVCIRDTGWGFCYMLIFRVVTVLLRSVSVIHAGPIQTIQLFWEFCCHLSHRHSNIFCWQAAVLIIPKRLAAAL